MMKVKQNIKQTRSLDYKQVRGDLFVFSYSVKTEYPKAPLFSGKTTTSNEQGFVLKENLDEFIATGANLKTEDQYAIASPEFLEFRRTCISGLDKKEEDQARKTLSRKKYFDSLESGIVIRGDGDMMFDLDDNPLPIAIYFDYIMAHMDNTNYDLEKAVEILKKNPQVRFIKQDRWCDTIIEPIPSYNASEERNQCITFVFSPTSEQAKAMWNIQKRHKYPGTERFRAVFELDLLGLRSGGAAKFKTFLGEYGEGSDQSDKD
jgi:hypothetical protein